MASWRKTKKALKNAAPQKPLVAVMMREDANVATLAEFGIECDDYFDPRGKTGLTDNKIFGLDCVVVTFTQNVPDRPCPRVHTLDVPRSMLVPA